MSDNVHMVGDPVREPDDWSFLIECDYCPYCGRKAHESGPVELHVFWDQTSVVFHNPIVDVNDFCEIPDSLG